MENREELLATRYSLLARYFRTNTLNPSIGARSS
jgi:hypothetical protein